MTQGDTKSDDLARADDLAAHGDLPEALRLASTFADDPRAAALRATLRADLGDYDAASRDALDPGDDPLAQTWAARARGRVAVARGEVEAGMLRYDDALHRARQLEDAREQVRIQLLAAQALLDRDGPSDPSAAVARLAEARTIAAAERAAPLRLELRLLLARGRATTGDVDGGVLDATTVLDEAKREGRPDLEWRALATLGMLEGQRGSDFVARKHDLAAMEVLEALAVSLPPDLRDAFWQDPARRALRVRASATTDRYVPAAAPRGYDAEGAVSPRVERLLEILKRLASEHDLGRLLERITDAAVELSGAERGFVLLPEDGVLEPKLVRTSGAAPDDPSVAFSRSIAEAVFIDGEPILTVDARDDRRLSEYLSVHKLMLKSVACLPIRGRTGSVGVLYLEHRIRRGRFRDDDLDMLLAFADQAAIALENARLVSELEGRKEELEQANRELEDAKAEIERVLVARTDELAETKRELDRTRVQLRGRYRKSGIIGRSEAMRRVFAVIDRVAETNVPVVIQGESGTGKELVARAIHYASNRTKKPFIALNCAAIPEALLESELFGHVKGAFTGADRDRRGVLSRANGGTLFLDEVGDMPAKMQVDLLRVLQDGKVRPVGGEEEEQVDVRILSASNKMLRDQVAKREFREDLYYRLNVVEIRLPPLRERAGDLPLLVDHVLERIAESEGASRKRITKAALDALSRHPLPGNVRQLEHVLLNACVMTEGDTIDAGDLALGDVGANEQLAASAVEPAPASRARPPAQNLDDFKTAEKQRILAALEEHNWNRAKAARSLGIPRRTFYRRLKEHDIL